MAKKINYERRRKINKIILTTFGVAFVGIFGLASCAPSTTEPTNEAPKVEATKVEAPKVQEKAPTKVYEDGKVKIYFTKVNSIGVEFLVENNMDKQITIQCDSIAINGFSQSKVLMSDEIAPKSKGKITAMCNTNDFDKDVKTISGALSIIDFENYEDTYNAEFSNIEVK